MSGQGISQIVFYAIALVALGYPLGHLDGARLHRAARRRAGSSRSLERGFYRVVRTDPTQRAGLEGLRQDRARLQRPLLGRPLRDPARSRGTCS